MTDDYDAVTARDIADLLHHLASLRTPGPGDDPAERAAFLAHKAALFTRIADQHALRDPAYAQQVRQMAADALAAAAEPRLPQQRLGPNHGRTRPRQPNPGGASSQEKSGTSSG